LSSMSNAGGFRGIDAEGKSLGLDLP